jgi:hypothetical protein
MNQKTAKLIKRYATLTDLTYPQYRALKAEWKAMSNKDKHKTRQLMKQDVEKYGS